MIALAYSVTWQGRTVWVPPYGNPFFTDRNPAQDMTPEQVADFWKWWQR